MLGDPSTKLKLPSYPASSLRSLKAIDWIFEILKSSRLASKVFFLSELIITFLSFRLQYFQEFFQFISGFLQFNREIPDDEKFLHSAAMSQLDPQCLRSLNGYRATAEILELVPDIRTLAYVLVSSVLFSLGMGIHFFHGCPNKWIRYRKNLPRKQLEAHQCVLQQGLLLPRSLSLLPPHFGGLLQTRRHGLLGAQVLQDHLLDPGPVVQFVLAVLGECGAANA